MSVHQESLDMNKKVESAHDAPELEYSAYRHDLFQCLALQSAGQCWVCY